MKKLYLSLIGAIFLLAFIPCALAQTRAQPSPVAGLWQSRAGTIFELYPCNGEEVCGRIVWLKRPRDANGVLRKNFYDPSKSMCGSEVATGLRSDANGTLWKGGTVIDVEKGGRYGMRARLKGPNLLETRFFKGISFLGRTEPLTRVAAIPGPC
jgi:uncharacterized protein (DUF2147 family)